MMRYLLLPVLFSMVLFSNSVSMAQNETETKKINIVTTIGMITDAVQVIGGERVSVNGLMGPGVDPHLYKATEGDVMRLASAEVIFYGGLHLEAKMGELFAKMGRKIKTVAISDAIPRERLLEDAVFKGNYDPHIWFDVALWSVAVAKIRDELISFDPENREYYAARAESYLKDLADLDDYVRRKAAEVLPDQRVLVTAHDAFNYFGRAYGYEVVGLQGISTESEAGAADVQNLADLIAKRKIKAIFIETSIPVRNIQAVQEAVKARGWDVKIGGKLFSDAMGNPGTPEGAYIGMVKHNINTVAAALTEEVPMGERGDTSESGK